MRAILPAIIVAAFTLPACDTTESNLDTSERSAPPAHGSSPRAAHDETAGLMARQVLPGAWQAGVIRRFHSAEGSKRVQGVKLGGDDATEPMIQRLDEAVVQQSLRDAFQASRWVFFPDGTFEVRAYKGHLLSARLMGTYSPGTYPWTIAGDGRSQDNRPVPDGQRVSATVQYENANEIVLQVSFDCTFGDASLGAARMAGGGWGTTWTFNFASRFDLVLERGIHRPNQGNALVLAGYPIPLENPAIAPQARSGDDPLMDNARRTIEGADQLIANGKAKQAFDQGFWEFYPDGTFRYTHDPLRFFPMHELEGRWEDRGEGTLRYSAKTTYGEGILATTVSIDGELISVDSKGAQASLTFRSQDDMARYEYTFRQRYRVDQLMGK